MSAKIPVGISLITKSDKNAELSPKEPKCMSLFSRDTYKDFGYKAIPQPFKYGAQTALFKYPVRTAL